MLMEFHSILTSFVSGMRFAGNAALSRSKRAWLVLAEHPSATANNVFKCVVCGIQVSGAVVDFSPLK